jgi:glycosyltransferase involved in cell wall biosynthesis
MFSSTIIPTINRSSLSRAVYSVLEQNFTAEDFEVIVVNDSGKPLPDMEWQRSERVHILNTNRRERSVARNAGAAIAKGRYLHFLDDDDILLPGALDAFWRLDQEHSDAVWLYGSYRSVDNDGNLVEEFHPGVTGNIFAMLVASEAIPFQVSLLKAEYFFKAGAFDPTITGVEDRDLGRRMGMLGTVAYASEQVAQIRIGELGSTTNWSILAEDDRRGREKAFLLPNSYARLWASANSCQNHGVVYPAYWHGRVCRAYIASMSWNLRRRNYLTALGRALAGAAFTGLNFLSSKFWLGIGNKPLPRSNYPRVDAKGQPLHPSLKQE